MAALGLTPQFQALGQPELGQPWASEQLQASGSAASKRTSLLAMLAASIW